jgi:hypothetical protein
MPKSRTCLGCLALAAAAGRVAAQPISQVWPVDGGDDTLATAAAQLSGVYACADSFEDSVEVRDIRRALIRSIPRERIAALLPWMNLGGGQDGPSGVTLTDSGRLLFILVHDANAAPGGQPSDAVLRYDIAGDALSVFARLELFDRDDEWPHLAAAHFKGQLHAGSHGIGGPGVVRTYSALRNTLTPTLLSSSTLPAGTAVHGLAVDRNNSLMYAASESAIYRTSLNTLPLTWTLVGSVNGIRGIAYSDNVGAPGQTGLHVLSSDSGTSSVRFVPQTQLLGAFPFAPTLFMTTPAEWHSIASTADGGLLVGADEDALHVTNAADTRLSYEAWLRDEFQQVVTFAKGLISPGGPGNHPAGWVIDGDVQVGGTRFHPASPDGAAWAILLLLMSERLDGDPEALPLVRLILTRYAGLALDGIGPSKTADGIMRHWIDPATGGVKAGWDPEFATLSTMKIVLAASRARARWPQDAAISAAAGRIICQLRNHDAYFESVSDATYFKGLVQGGPDLSSRTTAFSEAILWTEQLGYYGSAISATKHSHWMNRSLWPIATFVDGRPVTGNGFGAFQSAFTSLYSLLVHPDFRASGEWQAQIVNIRESHSAWTDDNGPQYCTVFSAGTTKPEWGFYHADSLGNHPGDLTTFPSLMALSGTGQTASSVGAYNAYRRGARETFSSGASILYRRSNADRTYTPPDAGLPDVVLGALGLAELILPGSLGATVALPYAPCCWANCDNSSGAAALTANDFQCFLNKFASGSPYANCDGSTGSPTLTPNDFLCYFNAFAAGCS